MEKINYEKPMLIQLAIITEPVLAASGNTTDYSEEIGEWEV